MFNVVQLPHNLIAREARALFALPADVHAKGFVKVHAAKQKGTKFDLLTLIPKT